MANFNKLKSNLFKIEYHLFLLMMLYVISAVVFIVYLYNSVKYPGIELDLFNLLVVLAFGVWRLNYLFKIQTIKERSHDLNNEELMHCRLCKSTNVTHYCSENYYDFIVCTDCGHTLNRDDLSINNPGLVIYGIKKNG